MTATSFMKAIGAINLEMTFRKDKLKLRVVILELIPKMNPIVVDYIALCTISSSKDIVEECGLNAVTVPLSCI